MLSLAFSAAMLGIDGYVVRVQADTSPGSPHFTIIGLPDRALKEANHRVRSAIWNSGFMHPPGHVLVNLSPADVRKEGPSFDLPIALALLGIEEQLDRLALQNVVAFGELMLDGKVRGVDGMLPMVLGARAAGFTQLILPEANAAEAALVDGVEIYAVDSLQSAVAVLMGHGAKWRYTRRTVASNHCDSTHGDFCDVRGQYGAKRALEIAAAGGHNLLFVGPPGCGKTMLARRLPSILPPMSADEALDVTKIYSVAGLLRGETGIVRARPFRAPHHTISQTALVGGGGTVVKPGEISLAHHGVLFLDELPEFSRSSIEVMRQPLEEGAVTIARAIGTFTYPSRFMLVASMNPCPCGYRGTRTAECRCDDAAVAKYVSKLSGPLLDRIDLQIEISRVPFDEMVRDDRAERSASIRERVVAARERQQQRFTGIPIGCNAQIPGNAVRKYCALGPDAVELLKHAASKRQFSARALDRIARAARTIADLANADEIAAEHVAEAINYRSLERLDSRAA
ncbi:MAG: YifB family Mg chelatase-like AAA ATPase [Candidatus Eremiobacteraeota bacterium]|nr:YifB family Mg chelatase-like AAA ATPase [Candidatus Eremiobacteraeota bacterium]